MSSALTVVVPTLGNRHDYLRESVHSILAAGPIVDVIVVGPSDALPDFGAAFSVTFLDDPGGGPAAAINSGLRFARTRYVSWLGDDDLIASHRIESVCALLDASPDAPFAFGNCWLIDSVGLPISLMRPGRIALPLLKIGPDRVPQPGSILRRSAVEAIGYLNTGLSYAFDLDLFLRLSRVGRPERVHAPLACFRLHAQSLTVSNPRPGFEARQVRRSLMSPTLRLIEPLAYPSAQLFTRLLAKYQWHFPGKEAFAFGRHSFGRQSSS